jgi:hypothetical protein
MKRAIYIGSTGRQAWRRAVTSMVLASAGLGVWAGGCSSPDAGARVDPIGPDRAQFDFVAPVLARRCGSLDCHGSIYRNMRVFGYGGTRLDGGVTPESPARVTADEAQATYESVIGVEPEIMRAVVQSGGAGPERLTFVRKGRGDEDHKGDSPIKHGDNSDRCILTWLSNTVDQAACKTAACIVDIKDDAGKVVGSEIQSCK